MLLIHSGLPLFCDFKIQELSNFSSILEEPIYNNYVWESVISFASGVQGRALAKTELNKNMNDKTANCWHALYVVNTY